MSGSKFQKKAVKEFLSAIRKNSHISESGTLHRYPKYSQEPILNYLFSLDKRAFTALISSPYWSNYPGWTSYPAGKKPYGEVISFVIREAIFSSNIIRDLFAKKSSGLWHRLSLDYLRGPERVLCAKRGLKSSDKRVRLKSVEIVPVNTLIRNIQALLSDKHKSISWKLLSRLGPDNYSDIVFEYSTCNWTKRDALRRRISEKIPSLELIMEEIDKLSTIDNNAPLGYNSIRYAQRELVCNLINRAKTSDVPFLLACDSDLLGAWNSGLKRKLRVREWAQD